MMAATLKIFGCDDRDIYLYDTFAGMTEPGIYDVKLSRNMTAEQNMQKWEELQRNGRNERCFAPLDEVKRNVFFSGYPERRFHFVKGDVRETIPNDNHEEIAILRLDTDFYEATKQELEHLYDLLVPGGVLIIDDYGSWAGCRKAVDDHFEKSGWFPFLVRTDRSERVTIKH